VAKRSKEQHVSGFFTKKVLLNLFLIANSFIWYLFSLQILEKFVTASDFSSFETNILWISHFSTLIVAAILGAFLTKRLGGRRQFLIIWLILGTVAPFTAFLVNPTVYLGTLFLSLFFAGTFGVGMPNLMGYYTDQTSIETHGRIGGLIILAVGFGTIIFGQALNIESVPFQTLILSLWRAAGLAALLFVSHKELSREPIKASSYTKLIRQRRFILYFIPWLMFALLNYLTTPVQVNVLSQQVIINLNIIGNIFLAAAALIGGFLMDSLGRKRIAIVGFVMLGLSYSMIGILQDQWVWYVHTVINGISWGMLYVLFVVTIWGDLTHGEPSDKYYALGVIPFFLSKFLELTISSEIVNAIPLTEIFSFTAFFLFLAVLPLIYAPETLSEKHIKDRELKNYLEKANKVKQKYS
jgi:MFS family permease